MAITCCLLHLDIIPLTQGVMLIMHCRVHQFDKVEQFAVTPPGQASWEMLSTMITNASDFYDSLGIPHRQAYTPVARANMTSFPPPASVREKST